VIFDITKVRQCGERNVAESTFVVVEKRGKRKTIITNEFVLKRTYSFI